MFGGGGNLSITKTVLITGCLETVDKIISNGFNQHQISEESTIYPNRMLRKTAVLILRLSPALYSHPIWGAFGFPFLVILTPKNGVKT